MTGPRRLSRLLLALLVGMLAMLPVTAAAQARADDSQQVAVTFGSIDPAMPDRNSTITLIGTVKNTSGEPLSNTQVLFWRDYSPITDHDSLETAAGQSERYPTGRRQAEPGAFQTLTRPDKPTIAPDESVRFQVQVKVQDLELPRVSGAYLIGVHVMGQVGRGGNTLLGRGRTFVTLPASNAPVAPVPTVTVAALTSSPSMVRPGLFADDHLAAELAENGRLTALLRAAMRPQVSYLIDPSLLQEINTMATGYQVLDAKGQVTPGGAGNEAQRWLRDFQQLDTTRGYRVPFATPDVTMLSHRNLDQILAQAEGSTQTVAGVDDLPEVAYAASGHVDAEAIPLIEKSRPVAIFASNARSSQSLLAPLDSVPLVSYSEAMFGGGPAPDPRTTLVQLRQRLLATSYLDAMEGRTQPVVRLLDSREAAIGDLASDSPWLRRITLGELLKSTPGAWSKTLDYTSAMREGELNDAQVQRLEDLGHSYASQVDMMVEPDATRTRADATMARCASSWWRGDGAGYAAFLRDPQAETRALLSGSTVSLTAQQSVIMSGQSGSFPVTVTNKLNDPIKVAIDFQSSQPGRLSIPRHGDIEVGPRMSATVNVRPQAVGNGPVSVTAQLTTPGGTPLGKTANITVTATRLGEVGWIIVAASGAVLVAMTAWRIRQVRHERLKEDLSKEHDMVGYPVSDGGDGERDR